MRHALILGANGFLGQHLTTALLHRQVEVTGYGRNLPTQSAPSHFIQGDFSTENRFQTLLAAGRFDVVYHFISTTSPAPHTGNALQEMEENVLPTVRLLDAMRGTGAELVFASSGGTVYGESAGAPHRCDDALYPICSYGIQKTTIESFLRLYNRGGDVRCKICRISNPYGSTPQQDRTQGIIPILLRRLLTGDSITLYGDTVRDYIFISDVTRALLAATAYTGEACTFNVGTGVGTSLRALVTLLEQCAGQVFASVGTEAKRTCDVQESVLDIEQTVKQLDWKPEVALEDGISRTLAALKEQRSARSMRHTRCSNSKSSNAMPR